MADYSFDIEFITPCFMSGADQKIPELRAPSIKGAMRYWFRAMMGKILNDNVSSLRQFEGAIFGNMRDEKSATASKFVLETMAVGNNVPYDVTQSKPAIGLRYLGFPFYPQKGDKPRQALSFLSKQQVTIRLRPICSDQEAKLIIATFWLMSNLGNIGSRSRRGFGSFRVLKTSDDITFVNFKCPREIDRYPIYLETGLRQVENIFSTYLSKPPAVGKAAVLPMFDSFSKYSGLLLKDATWLTWEKTLDSIGLCMREFRLVQGTSSARAPIQHGKSSAPVQYSNKTQDYTNVVRAFLQRRPQPPQADLVHDIFGLPILYRPYKSSQIATLTYELPGASGERRASPLIIHPILCGKQYGILVNLFESKFLPNGAEEILSSGGSKLRIKEADYSIMKNQFINMLINKFITHNINY
jgi:CRISPR-associated protein Cmr1